MSDDRPSSGPLAGLKVIEFAGIGPVPHCAMLLADLGADVVRVEREGGNGWPNPIMERSRAIKQLDIRTAEGRAWCREAALGADILLEGYRPGVMERLGLGPEELCLANPRLIYGRVTGWGQQGPLSASAGHDLNYIAITGALAAMGRPGEPAAVPLNLIGDFGGGSMLLAFGLLAALFERERSGKGQVVDAAIVDGVASMMTMFTGLVATDLISLDRKSNILGGAAPFYRTYLCKDNREVALGAIEPHFFAAFLEKLGLSHLAEVQYDEAGWPALAAQLAVVFASEDRDHWAALFEGSDACLTPVLTVDEALQHPHNVARDAYVEHEAIRQVCPVPRFSRTPGAIQPVRNADEAVRQWDERASEPVA